MNKKKIIIIALSLLLFFVAGAFVGIFGKQDVQKIKDKFNNSTQTEININVNLLKNSNFSLNDSGIREFNETNVTDAREFINNWKITLIDGAQFVMYQVNDGLYIRTESNVGFGIYQSVSEVEEKLANRDLTLTISVDDVVYSTTGILTDVNNRFSLYLASSQIVASLNIDSGVVAVNFNVNANSNFTVNWVKLELGNVFTGYIAE